MIIKLPVNYGTKSPCCHHPKTKEACIYSGAETDCFKIFSEGKREMCTDPDMVHQYIFVNRNIFTYFIRKVLGI